MISKHAMNARVSQLVCCVNMCHWPELFISVSLGRPVEDGPGKLIPFNWTDHVCSTLMAKSQEALRRVSGLELVELS